MKDILLEIVTHKREEIARQKQMVPLEQLAENAGRTLPFETAADCFPEYTPGCVARQFLQGATPGAKGDAL